MPSQYSIGLDFGTNSVRALIVDVRDGRALSSFTWPYTYGHAGVILDPAVPDLARQHPADYLGGIEAAVRRVTTDGTEPTAPGAGESGREGAQLTLKETTTIKAALFVSEPTSDGAKRFKKIGATVTGTWTRTGDAVDAAPVALLAPEKPLAIADVLPRVTKVTAAAEAAMEGGKFDATSNSQLARGKRLFTAAGCAGCHRVGNEGQTFGPDLTAMGDKADARHLLESLIEPNAIIAEGFSLNVVSTRDGKSYSGIFRDETNRRLLRSGMAAADDRGRTAGLDPRHGDPVARRRSAAGGRTQCVAPDGAPAGGQGG
jgi:putative heme-binding domain-containing protein